MATKAPTTKTKRKRERLVWVDCEMTGLDTDKDTLLEVAVIVTEGDLSIVAEGPNLGWLHSYLNHLGNYTKANIHSDCIVLLHHVYLEF